MKPKGGQDAAVAVCSRVSIGGQSIVRYTYCSTDDLQLSGTSTYFARQLYIIWPTSKLGLR